MNKIFNDFAKITDCLHATPIYCSQGYPMVRVENVNNRFLNLQNCLQVSEETCDLHNKNHRPQMGDIIITRVGSYGMIALVNTEEKFCLGQNIAIISPFANSRFFYYYLLSPYIQKNIYGNSGGSSYKSLSLEQIRNLPVNIEGLKIERIGDLLYLIDSKIELNNKIISELESMAKILYDYWFLQFDFPDENGKPYKSSGGKMVYNEELKREIPEGWEVKSLSQVILSSKNGDWGNEISKAVNDVQVRCFRGADFSSIVSDYNLTAPIRFISESHRDRLLMDGDLVIEISGGSPTQATGRIGYINQSFLDRSDCAMTCSNFCKAFVPLSKNHQYWLYQIWKSYYDNGIMFNFESKTTGIKNLMFDDFCESIKVPVPCLELLQDYQNKVSAFYNLIQRSLNENSDLASLRDFLLPMLMNGQVTFKDAAEAHND
ncbi:restriction endonuclease subunit S [uncultured Phascolarctobacterium sp.]|uniref:restriction endonuclease subunit S n=1 Tax=uncultured Phascolarctobacterium sp. TaxID=512296 RepID=UPI0025DD7047|nr:restriction endonuclease subunit S [uncultured Phascolarctobacterium sp.]